MSNKTFLGILDEVCLNVFQDTFAGLSDNSKSYVKNTVNAKYTEICNYHRDWDFLNKVLKVKAWEPDTDALLMLTTGTHAPTVKYNVPAVTAGNSVYIAQSKANSLDIPLQFTSLALYLGYTGTGSIDASGWALVCPDDNGKPDLDNYYGISDELALKTRPGPTALTKTGSNKIFTFTNPTAVPKNCTYWIVFKFTANVGGASFTTSTVTETLTSYSLNPASSTSWTENTGVGIYIYGYYYRAEYSNTLTVGPGVQEIFGFYDLLLRDDRNASLTEIMSRPDLEYVNTETYEVKRLNADGTWTVNFKTTSLPLYWFMEYKAVVNAMTADTEEPLIPQEFRNLIVIKTILQIRADGRGLNAPDNLKLLMSDYSRGIRDLEMTYRKNELNIEPEIGAKGSTPSGLVYTTGFDTKRRGRLYGRLL